VPGWLNIGVLHTALEGNAEHPRYAPCSVGELQARLTSLKLPFMREHYQPLAKTAASLIFNHPSLSLHEGASLHLLSTH
jgi:hypothetical protein